MKVLVLGATGKTGALVLERALQQGHEVTVLVRDPAKIRNTGVRVVQGDTTRPSDVLKAMAGQDAAIDTIGGTAPYKETNLETRSAENLIAAMRAVGARRLIVVSMMGIGESAAQAPSWYRYLLMTTFLRGSTPDKTAMEHAVMASGLEYVIARPPILKDDAATGSYRILEPGETGHAITRADLADFLVEQLGPAALLGRAVTVVNR
jgi:putative NADH-flavin reductase